MKSSFKMLRGLALSKNNHKEKRENRALAHEDELIQASKDMVDMRNCYDNLLSAAAAIANSAYEFSEALREMGTCLLEKTALDDGEATGKVFLMLGKVQFELQKLIDSYRVHIIQTITNPSESLLKELQTVEDMKHQCDDKRDLYKSMLVAHREKGKSRSTKGESFSSQQLQAAKEDYEEEANLFVFHLKSLKQGQTRSLLTQAARHHAAQLNFFKKGVKSLELVEPHVKVAAKKEHIDYQFSGLEVYTEGDDEYGYSYDGNDNGELSFDYGQHDRILEVSLSRNSTEENLGKIQRDFLSFNRRSWASSQSAPILADKIEAADRINQMPPSLARKARTYILPTPADAKRSPSPSNPSTLVKDIKNGQSSPTKIPKPQSVLRESNINSGPIRLPLPSAEGVSLSKFDFNNSFDTKKIQRQAYSGPLTSKAGLSKPSFSAPEFISAQPFSSPKVPPNASPPPILSPKHSGLHELPRPPTTSAEPARHLVGHSAPLVSRGKEFYAATKEPTLASRKASPLPTPPLAMARSFSIPSGGQRTPTLTAPDINDGSFSPPLTPISPSINRLASDSITRATKPKGIS